LPSIVVAGKAPATQDTGSIARSRNAASGVERRHNDERYLDGGAPVIEEVTIQITWVCPEADLPLPQYMTAGAAGMDVVAAVSGGVEIAPLGRELIPTGIAVAIPPGFEIQVRPRSGLAWRQGLTVLNAPGTIDADYRGEVKVLLVNLGAVPAVVQRGDRIAQLVLAPVARAVWQPVGVLPETARSAGGFGHTDAAAPPARLDAPVGGSR
jgi:dUTP pyrophosphatase